LDTPIDKTYRNHCSILGQGGAHVNLSPSLSTFCLKNPGELYEGQFLFLHILCSDGCFYREEMFRVAPRFDTKTLEKIFRHKVFKMLFSKGKITKDIVGMLLNWRHSGFNVFCGQRIQPGDEKAMENIACYIVRASNDLYSGGIQGCLSQRMGKKKKSLTL
jgi:hypothetical protein